ncbi:MAG: hypothetical protein J5691_01495 [Bacilli bacterium]|nr:hypothetical protein [Bacilli bacterium]
MARKKSNTTIEKYSDEYFINLTMPFDKRDDEVYSKWAIWCALSEDKYCIRGKDGYFYTHKITTAEKEAKSLPENVPEYDEWKDLHNIK